MINPLSAIARTPKQQAMLVFLAADAVMFFSFYAAYVYLRRQAPSWPVVFHFPSALMAVTMTMFAITASVLAHVASARERDDLLAVRSLVAAIACWLCFLFIEAIEWARLIWIEGVTLRANPFKTPLFGASFYTLSGLHAIHVAGGIVYLCVVASRLRKHDLGALALYVHFTNAMWLILFPTLYLSAADLQGL